MTQIQSVKIVINACAEGVTVGVEVDGELASNRTMVPIGDDFVDTKPGDIFSDMPGYPDLAEVLSYAGLGFFGMDLLNWFWEDEGLQKEREIHPQAFRNNDGGFIDGNFRRVVAGDRVEYRFEDHRRGVLDEALQDGDAFVTWDNGAHGTVKWHHLAKIVEDGDV